MQDHLENSPDKPQEIQDFKLIEVLTSLVLQYPFNDDFTEALLLHIQSGGNFDDFYWTVKKGKKRIYTIYKEGLLAFVQSSLIAQYGEL